MEIYESTGRTTASIPKIRAVLLCYPQQWPLVTCRYGAFQIWLVWIRREFFFFYLTLINLKQNVTSITLMILY